MNITKNLMSFLPVGFAGWQIASEMSKKDSSLFRGFVKGATIFASMGAITALTIGGGALLATAGTILGLTSYEKIVDVFDKVWKPDKQNQNIDINA